MLSRRKFITQTSAGAAALAIPFDSNSFSGKTISVIYDGNLVTQSHQIPIELSDVVNGEYIVSIKKTSGIETLKLLKVKSL